MGSALEEFRAQRRTVDEMHARLTEVATLLSSLSEETAKLAHDDGLRTLLKEEQTWLRHAEQLVQQVQAFRECESYRLWPATWRRWAVAIALAVVTALAAGAGYVWAARPYAAELSSLRMRAELGDAIAHRMITMTPAERREFEILMKWTAATKR